MAEEEDTVAVANRELEERSKGLYKTLESISMKGIRIVESRKGFLRCRFVVSDRITDGDGNWHVGAMTTLIDVVSLFAIYSVVGHVKASVDFNVSFFSTAKALVGNSKPNHRDSVAQEEVELEGKVVREKGKLGSVVIEVTRTRNGELIALGKQWMYAQNKRVHSSSKL